MNTIYRPKGKALEYGELALNLYRGCSFGCTYCYAPSVLKLSREQFLKPEPRKDILPAIEKVAEEYRGKNIFLCFTCDPYQPIEEEHEITRRTIAILHSHGCTVRILTKAGSLAMRDIQLLGPGDAFGVTLTSLNVTEFEPFAAKPIDRIVNLATAHARGVYTWVSLEPVLDPQETLDIIDVTQHLTDEFKVGMWNYDRRADAIDWKKFLKDVVELLDSIGKKYYIKEDLRKAANEHI